MAINFSGQGSRYATTALAAEGVISAASGYLLHFRVINTNGATRYIQLFNAAAVPANTAIPDRVLIVGTGAQATLDLQDIGDGFGAGISWCTSTTLATKTVGAADAWVEALYVHRRV